MRHEIIKVPGKTIKEVEWYAMCGEDAGLPSTFAVASFKVWFGAGASIGLVDDFDSGFMHSAEDVKKLRAEINPIIDALVDLDCALRSLLLGTQIEMFSEEELSL